MSDEEPGPNIYVWQELDPKDNRWGTIAELLPGISFPMPLIMRSEEMARACTVIAHAHARASGHKIRLVRYAFAEVLEEGVKLREA